MKAFMYISRATSIGLTDWMPDGYTSILNASKVKNAQHNVNGFLCYQNGYFFQYVEGPKRGLEHVLVSILNDHRHSDIHILLDGKVVAPNFENWRVPLGNRLMHDAAFRRFTKRYQRYFANQSDEHTEILKGFHVYDSLSDRREFDGSAEVEQKNANDSALYLLAV